MDSRLQRRKHSNNSNQQLKTLDNPMLKLKICLDS